VARGPSFFSLLLRKGGGWIVSRRLSTAWMEGMLTLRRRPGACCLCVGAAPLASAAALLHQLCSVTACCCLAGRARHRWGAARRAQTPALRESPRWMGAVSWFEAPGRRTAPGVWPQARLARHALAGPRVTSPSRGTSLCCSESLAAPAERHREERSPGCPEAATPRLRSQKLPPAPRRA